MCESVSRRVLCVRACVCAQLSVRARARVCVVSPQRRCCHTAVELPVKTRLRQRRQREKREEEEEEGRKEATSGGHTQGSTHNSSDAIVLQLRASRDRSVAQLIRQTGG